jgi:hypothetical protein
VPGFFESAQCTNETNRECAGCPMGEWFCNGTITECVPMCSEGTYESQPCSAATARVCSECPVEAFCPAGVPPVNCSTPCGRGAYESTECTATTDRVCAQCRRPTGVFSWTVGCSFLCGANTMLQSPNRCVAITAEPAYKNVVQMAVTASKASVCANTNQYVSEFCMGLSQLNPSNKFVCAALSIDYEPCDNGVCVCAGTRRRLLEDGCVLGVSVQSVSTGIVLPTRSNLPWVESAQLTADTTPAASTGSTGAIVGTVAAVGVVGAVAAACWCARRRKMSQLAIKKKTDALPQSRADLVFVDRRLRFEPWF